MNFELTGHAKKVMESRGIPMEWIELTVTNPVCLLDDPNDPEVKRFYRSIPEFGGRILRVAVNTAVAPNRIVSVFFDRTMKGKL